MAEIPTYVSNARFATGSVVNPPGDSPTGGALEQAGDTFSTARTERKDRHASDRSEIEKSLTDLNAKMSAASPGEHANFQVEGLNLIAATALPAAEKEELSRQWTQSADETAWLAYAHSDPIAAKAALGADGEEMVAPRYRAIPSERRTILVAEAEAQKQHREHEAYRSQVEAQTRRRDDYTRRMESREGLTDAEIASDRLLSIQDRNELIRRNGQQVLARRDAGNVWRTIGNEAGFNLNDPANRNGLAHIFKVSGGIDALLRDDPPAVGTTFTIWQKTGAIADEARDELLDLSQSGDDAKLVKAHAILEKLQRENPRAFHARFPANVGRDVLTYRRWRNSAQDEGKLAERLRQLHDPREQARRNELRIEGDRLAQIYHPIRVTSFFDERHAMGRALRKAPLALDGSAQMAAEFRAAFADFYMRNGGNAAQAEADAIVSLKQAWGPSATNGGEVSRYPIESHYAAQFDADPDWARRELDDLLRKLGATYTETVDVTAARGKTDKKQMTGVKPYRLVALPSTNLLIKSGLPPQYGIRVLDPVTGAWDDLHHPDGSYVLWPDANTVIRANAKSAADRQAAAQARGDRIDSAIEAVGSAAATRPSLTPVKVLLDTFKVRPERHEVRESTINQWVKNSGLDGKYQAFENRLRQDLQVWVNSVPGRQMPTDPQIANAVALEKKMDYLALRYAQMNGGQISLKEVFGASDEAAAVAAGLYSGSIMAIFNRAEFEAVRSNAVAMFTGVSSPLDKYRHIYGSYRASQRLGEHTARSAGIINEGRGLYTDFRQWLRGNLTSGGPRAFEFQDLFSNEVGINMHEIEMSLPENWR